MRGKRKIYINIIITSLLIMYLIGVFSGLFRYLGKYFLSFDNQVRDFLIGSQTQFWDAFFSIITLFGGVDGFAGIGVLILGIFLFYRKRDFLLPFIITIIGTEVFILIGKAFTGRIRPTGEEYSFPSNHAAIALAFYAFVNILINNKNNKKINSTLTFIVNCFLLIIIVLIGFSRLYLDEHFFSDVMMGYIVAGLWLILEVNFHKYHILRDRTKI